MLHSRKMSDRIKSFIKQFLPHGLCEYSVRRHAFLQQGFSNRDASRIALSPGRYESFCDARLDLLPKEITSRLRTCVDAGAHVGSWTASLLDLFKPERVLALECEPRLVETLRKRFRDAPQVTVMDVALAAGRGTTSFNRLQHPASSSLFQPRPEIGKEYQRETWEVIEKIQVQTIGYDELVKSEQEVSILKLDIQGAEKTVLAHAHEGLNKTLSLIMEVLFTPHYQDEGAFVELHQLMIQKGFGLYRFSQPYHRGGRALFADFAYVRENLLQGESRPPFGLA